jgi:hypothetical protein
MSLIDTYTAEQSLLRAKEELENTQETTLAPAPIEVPEQVVAAILKDYATDLIAEINGLILALDAKLGDADVVMARRVALMNVKTIIHDHVAYSVKRWRFPHVEALKSQLIQNGDKEIKASRLDAEGGKS